MPNTKTGTTWAPDIRPENIETFTETYTPEGGEAQTATYKAVDHHPFLQEILDKAAFFRTHVGAIWYNLAERKTLLAKLNEQDKAINALNAKILKYIDAPAVSVTLDNYYNIQIFPPGTRSYLFATVKYWDSSTTAFSVVGAGRIFYVVGDAGKTINGLVVRYWY